MDGVPPHPRSPQDPVCLQAVSRDRGFQLMSWEHRLTALSWIHLVALNWNPKAGILSGFAHQVSTKLVISKYLFSKGGDQN